MCTLELAFFTIYITQRGGEGGSLRGCQPLGSDVILWWRFQVKNCCFIFFGISNYNFPFNSSLSLPIFHFLLHKLLNLNLQFLHIFCHSTLQIYLNNNFLILFSNTIDYISHHISSMSIQSKSMWPQLSNEKYVVLEVKTKTYKFEFQKWI